jgi:monothiol glutaredoxin
MKEETEKRIKDIIASGDVVLFMKGVPAAPQCGFSASVVKILSGLAVPFRGVDVLADMDIREGIKSFSNWPTIP